MIIINGIIMIMPNMFYFNGDYMIINTGQRTDIPAFYSKWLVNRIKEGYVLVRNPYYPNLVTKYILDPKVVDVICFCTKNPKLMFPYLEVLSKFRQFWHITITAFGKDLEPNVCHVDEVIDDFKYLSKRLGSNAVVWRYTPIIINNRYPKERHLKAFEYIADKLEGYTNTVVFGFLDLYDKLNGKGLYDATDEDKIYIATNFLKIAKKHNMNLRLCSKEKWLKEYGIDVDGCIRLEDYEKAIGLKLTLKQKMQARKEYCSCLIANDIGSYNCCLHLCKYCYANSEPNSVLKNYQLHDENSPLLIGNIKPNDIIRTAKQESFIDNEINLFNI